MKKDEKEKLIAVSNVLLAFGKFHGWFKQGKFDELDPIAQEEMLDFIAKTLDTAAQPKGDQK